MLSSGEAMSKFMKNPRPYLLPPQPRPPVKLCVMGPPHSGKTTLCYNLAEKYGAQVKLSQYQYFSSQFNAIHLSLISDFDIEKASEH